VLRDSKPGIKTQLINESYFRKIYAISWSYKTVKKQVIATKCFRLVKYFSLFACDALNFWMNFSSEEEDSCYFDDKSNEIPNNQ